MNVDASTLGGLGASGAVVVLCWLVIGELRGLRPVFSDLRQGMSDLRDGLASVREVISALLERERIRAARKDSVPPMPKAASTISPAESWDDSTDLHDIIERQRRQRTRSPAGGVRVPRPGLHHDKDD